MYPKPGYQKAFNMAKKTKTVSGRSGSPLIEFFKGGRKNAPTRAAASSSGPINPNVKSGAAVAAAAESERIGLGSPQSVVRRKGAVTPQMTDLMELGIAIPKKFGDNFRKTFEDEARKAVFERETRNVNSPNFGNKNYVPEPPDVRAEAFKMAMREASTVDSTKLQGMLETMAREVFGAKPSGKVQKGITKADKPRAGLIGGNDIEQEDIYKLAAKARERRPHEINVEGINDDVLRNDVLKMQTAIDAGDEVEYAKVHRRFEQRLAANMTQEGDASTHDPSRTATKEVGGQTGEMKGRNAIYQESEGAPAGSETEGKTSIKGAIKREPSDITKDALDVIANDEQQLNKFLSRFSKVDQEAMRDRFMRIKDDPTSEAAQISRGDLLRAMDKALSIEGTAKNLSITDEGKGAKQQRALKGVAPSPVVELEKREEQAKNKGRVKAAIDAIAGIRVGYKQLPINEARKQMTSNISTIMDAFRGYTENRLLLRSIEGGVRNAAGKAAAGELGPINKIADVLRAVSSARRISTPEQQIAGRKGDMSQLEAILTGLGNRVRGGASTRRALPGRNVLTGKQEPPVRGIPAQTGSLPRPSQRTEVNYPSRSFKEAEAGIPAKSPAESSGQATFVPTRQRAEAAKQTGSIGSSRLQKGVAELQGRNPDRGPRKPDLESKDYVAPPAGPRGKLKPVVAATNSIDDIVDEYMSGIKREAAGASDKGYYEGGGKTDGASRLLVSRVRELTTGVKNSLKEIRRNRVPVAIRDANQLESAKAELAKLEKMKLNSDAEYDRVPQLLEVFAKDPALGQGYEGEYELGGREFRTSETKGGLFTRKRTVGEYKEQLQNQIKLLDRQVAGYQRVIAKAMKDKKISSRDAGVALRESERSSMNPKRQEIEKLRRRIQDHKPDPEEERLRAQRDLPTVLESMQRQLQEAMAKPVSRPKAGSNRPGAEKRPGYVRSDQPLDEMFAPTRGQSQRDLREPTGGEFSGGVIQERGRPMSDVMKRAQGKVNLKPKKKGRETVVQRDARRIRKNRDLAGLIEGLPG